MDLNSFDRLHDLYKETQFENIDRPLKQDSDSIQQSESSSDIKQQQNKVSVLPMTIINIGQMLTTNNNYTNL